LLPGLEVRKLFELPDDEYASQAAAAMDAADKWVRRCEDSIMADRLGALIGFQSVVESAGRSREARPATYDEVTIDLGEKARYENLTAAVGKYMSELVSS
jgi:hypothetical protein